MAKAYLVGSGIASLSAAAFLIRDGGFAGGDITILEEQDREGGSLDAAGSPEAGYTMRGGRMFERAGDRPGVVPPGSTNLAFIGQYAEVEDDVVFTVEYSVRTAWTAVATLLKLDKRPRPVYRGRRDPKVLVEALQTLHRR